MLGSRGRNASVKQTSKRPDSKASQKSGLLGGSIGGGGSSAGIEASSGSSSSSNSSGSAREASYLHQKLVKNQVQYLGSDGPVFTIAQPRRNNSQNQQNQSLYLPRTDLLQGSSSPNSSSKVNLEPTCIRKKEQFVANSDQRQRQQQHRRLQYQVHQQLQRIYGNTERRDQNQPSDTHQYSVNQQKQYNSNDNSHLNHKQQQQQQQQHQQQENYRQQLVDRLQQRSASSASVNFANQQQFRANMIKNPHHLVMVNSQSEQTYDSLSPASVSKQQVNEGFYTIDSNNPIGQRQNPISAIPEECNIDEEDEDELLIPQTVVASRVALDRKNQLEDLHYATATAAALLSATANAAAAFAANAEKQFDKKQATNELRGCSSTVEQQNLINTIYSDAYQEVRKQQRYNHNDTHPATLAAYKKQQQQQQHHPRNLIYSDPLDQGNCLGINNERQRMQIGPTTSTSSAIYSPLIRGNVANQSQIYGILPLNYQQYQAQNLFTRPMPPQPPLRRFIGRPPPVGLNNNLNHHNHHQQHHNDLINYHHQHLFQQQQQRLQQHPSSSSSALAIPLPIPTQMPTLAIVHQGKNTPIKADLLGRMLVNNMIAAQQAAAKSTDSSSHYATSSTAMVDRSRAMVEPRNSLVSTSMLSSGRDKIYRTPGPMFSVAPAIAPSESSGQSNLPLVLDRELKPLSFIERICRIDLAVFWWSLIIVSLIFIGVMITISRYVF